MSFHVEVVSAGKQEEAGARGLGHPPSAPKEAVPTPLHAACCKIENCGADLDCRVNSGRMREGTHRRIVFHRSSGNSFPRGIRIKGCGATLGDR